MICKRNDHIPRFQLLMVAGHHGLPGVPAQLHVALEVKPRPEVATILHQHLVELIVVDQIHLQRNVILETAVSYIVIEASPGPNFIKHLHLYKGS